MRKRIRLSRLRVVQITQQMKFDELARLAAGLGYVSAGARPFVVVVDSVAALNTVAEDDSFAWLRPEHLTRWPESSAAAWELTSRHRALLAYFAGLNNAYALREAVGNVPSGEVIKFVGRWREGGPWMILRAEFVTG